jgi:hypothetical protein
MAKRESAAERLRTFREMAADARRSAARSTNPENAPRIRTAC